MAVHCRTTYRPVVWSRGPVIKRVRVINDRCPKHTIALWKKDGQVLVWIGIESAISIPQVLVAHLLLGLKFDIEIA